jgi:hypothetical protein
MVLAHQESSETNDMETEIYKLFFAIGSCHEKLKLLAKRLETHPEVKGVTHWLDMYNVDNAFRMEEFVDAELTSGEAMSWALEMTLSLKRMFGEFMKRDMILWSKSRSATIKQLWNAAPALSKLHIAYVQLFPLVCHLNRRRDVLWF